MVCHGDNESVRLYARHAETRYRAAVPPAQDLRRWQRTAAVDGSRCDCGALYVPRVWDRVSPLRGGGAGSAPVWRTWPGARAAPPVRVNGSGQRDGQACFARPVRTESLQPRAGNRSTRRPTPVPDLSRSRISRDR